MSKVLFITKIVLLFMHVSIEISYKKLLSSILRPSVKNLSSLIILQNMLSIFFPYDFKEVHNYDIFFKESGIKLELLSLIELVYLCLKNTNKLHSLRNFYIYLK